MITKSIPTIIIGAEVMNVDYSFLCDFMMRKGNIIIMLCTAFTTKTKLLYHIIGIIKS